MKPAKADGALKLLQLTIRRVMGFNKNQWQEPLHAPSSCLAASVPRWMRSIASAMGNSSSSISRVNCCASTQSCSCIKPSRCFYLVSSYRLF